MGIPCLGGVFPVLLVATAVPPFAQGFAALFCTFVLCRFPGLVFDFVIAAAASFYFAVFVPSFVPERISGFCLGVPGFFLCSRISGFLPFFRLPA